jgi:hypothetical protein
LHDPVSDDRLLRAAGLLDERLAAIDDRTAPASRAGRRVTLPFVPARLAADEDQLSTSAAPKVLALAARGADQRQRAHRLRLVIVIGEGRRTDDADVLAAAALSPVLGRDTES